MLFFLLPSLNGADVGSVVIAWLFKILPCKVKSFEIQNKKNIIILTG